MRIGIWNLVKMTEFLSKIVIFLLCLVVYPEIARVFGYMGFKLGDFSTWRLIMSSLIIIILNFSSRDQFSKISTLFLWLPMLAVFCFGYGGQLLISLGLFHAAYFVVNSAVRRNFGANFILVDGTVLFLIVPVLVFCLFIFRDIFSFSNLLDVYENRGDYKSLAGTSLLSYVKGIVKISLVLLTAYSLIKKRYFFLACAVSIIFFGVFSSKYMLLMPLLILITYIALQKPKILLFMTCCAFALYLGLKLIDQEFFFVTIIRRALFLHSLLGESYLELYNKYGPQYYLNDALSFLGSGKVDVVYEAGLSIYGDLESHANTGFLGASVIQFGPILGPIIYGVFYGIWYGFCFAGARKTGPSGVIATYLAIQAVLISDIPQVLLLHGGLLLSIFLRVSDDRYQNFSEAKVRY